MAGGPVDILMYHSISDRGGPTSISPAIFKMQMDALKASDRPVVSIDALADDTWPANAVVITFDDAFQDFADNAWPVLSQHGFPAIVYVPTGRVGATEDWTGAMTPPRPLMDWPTMRRMSDQGVTFGNHTVSHPNLADLAPADMRDEIQTAKSTLEQELGHTIDHFAPPYGKTSEAVQTLISHHHKTSVGTDLNRARQTSDRFNLPRLEMFYFQSKPAWTRHLNGHGGPYLTLRKTLRGVRNMISHPAERMG